jgi:HEAT repeat protein
MKFLHLKKWVLLSPMLKGRLSLSLTFVFLSLLFAVAERTSTAQRVDIPVKITDVSARASDGGTVVTIFADGTLSKAQTWHDDEGYHVVLPNTVSDYSLRLARGVRIRRVGSSLEVLLQTKPTARVSMQSGSNQISLAVDGKLAARPTESAASDYSSPEEKRLFQDPQPSQAQQSDPSIKFSSSAEVLGNQTPQSVTGPAVPAVNPEQTTSAAEVKSNQGPNQNPGLVSSDAPPTEVRVEVEDEGFLASVFSGTSVLIVMFLGLFGLLVSRKLKSKQNLSQTEVAAKSGEQTEWDSIDAFENGTQVQPEPVKSLVKASDAAGTGGSRSGVVRMPVGPASLYGAYRIDQEVGKLLFGQPHRIDVLASRATEDRRAIETSLIKGVNSTELDETCRKRAREALEEYGFVARQCASLLLAPDAFERSSAARSLGEIKSAAALPFLLESLYDSEPIVRNQAVVSIGELKLPSAIGALLDIARTHPDVPPALLSRTLSACSVEGLDFFDAVVSEPALLGGAEVGSVVESIVQLEPAGAVENLPEVDDDERFVKALSAIESVDVGERSEALKTLVQFRVQSSVDAIAKVARHDSEPTVRSLAIAALGSIDHGSVFTAVLIGMADESREVRASAARSLTRLSFDRADAYVRVIEKGDEETIRSVAKACIQAGIISQNLDRLSNSDHRQAYETFSLICLLSKAKMNQPVLDAILDHPRIDVRLKAVHLLAATGQSDTFDQLRELALKDGVSEIVKTALLEAMYKLDQTRLQEDEGLEQAFEFHSERPTSPTVDDAPNVSNGEFSFDELQEIAETSFSFSRPDEVREGAFVVNEMRETYPAELVESDRAAFETNYCVAENFSDQDAGPRISEVEGQDI